MLFLYSTALAGLVTVLHVCLDLKSIIMGKFHYLLYILVLAMQVGIPTPIPHVFASNNVIVIFVTKCCFLSPAAEDVDDCR